MSIKDAFQFMLRLKAIDAIIYEAGDSPATGHTISVAQSNYFRNPDVIQEVTGIGREYVTDTKVLGLLGRAPKKGDRLKGDDSFGVRVISEVMELRGIGGVLYGYRMRLN